jgi:hypothetical protein
MYHSTDNGNSWLPEEILSDAPGRERARLSYRKGVLGGSWSHGSSAFGIHIETKYLLNSSGGWCSVQDITPIIVYPEIAAYPLNGLSSTTALVAWEHRDTIGSDFHIRCRVGILPMVNVSEVSPSLEGNFLLKNAYPNPFNGITHIRYTVPRKEVVLLAVYDILGKKVVELVNEPQEAGEYSVIWEADTAPSGVYFYRIKSGNRMAGGKVR